LDRIILDNKRGKRFHLFVMAVNLLFVLYLYSKGSVTYYSYLVILYCAIVCVFLYRSVELEGDFLYIRYPLRPFFRVQKRSIHSIRKVFFSLEEGNLAYPNIKLWFGRLNFMEIRLSGNEDELLSVLNYLKRKGNFKIACNPKNNDTLRKFEKLDSIHKK
jgi:hypothetical protein